MNPFKVTITDKRQGDCEICHQTRAVYEAKFENRFAAVLCMECLNSQMDYRKEKAEAVSSAPPKE